MNNLTWVEFAKDYSICKETSQIKSHAKKLMFDNSVRNKPEIILKAKPNSYIRVNSQSISVKKTYIKIFGESYDEYRARQNRANT